MRPPEFTGGNQQVADVGPLRQHDCFNEAAGIHRRKHLRQMLCAATGAGLQ